MRRSMLAALLAAAVLCSLANRLSAAMITFTGVVDEVFAEFSPVPFAVGDTFSATFTFTYHPDPSLPGAGYGPVTAYLFSVNGFTLSDTIKPGAATISLITEPRSDSNLLYQLFQFGEDLGQLSVFSEIILSTPTPAGIVPPLDKFSENIFYLQLVRIQPPGSGDPPQETASGHLTSLPTITGLTVPDGGTSVMLLGCSFLTLVGGRRSLRRGV
jgi:hypothetical protein